MSSTVPTLETILHLAQERGLDVNPGTAVLDENGWDFIVVMVTAVDGVPWVLRVPRRPEVAESIAVERRLLELVAGRLSVAVPKWEIGDSSIIAYPRLPGEPAASEDPTSFDLLWRIDRHNPPARYVEQLGRVMAELHNLSTDEAGAAGLPVRHPEDVRTRFAELLAFGVDELDMHHTWRVRGERWLDRPDLWSQGTVLIHGDLHPGHTLVTERGDLVGVLDWTDAEVGDPGQEFVEAARKFEPPMLDDLVEAYDRAGGPAWSGLRAHVVEAIAFAPLALARMGVAAGKERYVAAARTRYATPAG